MSVTEAREVCQHAWMIEALDRLVSRLASKQRQDDEGRSTAMLFKLEGKSDL